jgi:hypothetical protein
VLAQTATAAVFMVKVKCTEKNGSAFLSFSSVLLQLELTNKNCIFLRCIPQCADVVCVHPELRATLELICISITSLLCVCGENICGAPVLTPVILAIEKTEIRRIMV